jgi:hypothetical protein
LDRFGKIANFPDQFSGLSSGKIGSIFPDGKIGPKIGSIFPDEN